ncbi:MAG TPA: hypothetical protein DD432_01675 [Eubacterium sp.]|nr:hypothetical protein [Eubacterium sp.]
MKNLKKYISWFTVLILGLVFTMQFIPAKGIAASEENTAISFRFEGVVSSYEEMKAQGDTEYKTLAQAASDNNGVYSLDADVSSVSIYITLNKDKYMLMTDFNMFDTGISNAQTLTQKRTYSIQIDKNVLTVSWAYDEKTYGEDAWLEHGCAQITAIEGVNDFHDIPFANNPGDEKGGHIAVETGRKVTIKLIPDYGWQVAGLTLNGGEKLTPDDDNVSTFTFVMGDSNIHLKGLFEKASDEIKIDKGNTVKSVSISNGKNAVASGNLALTVSDNASYDSQKEQAVAEGAVYVSAVDFTLQQLVSKGNGSAWVSDVTEFEKPVTLNVSIDDYDENYDYIVIRNHNGEITKLDTTANEGTISFETNRFSTYVILKKEKSGAGQDSSDTAESGVDAGIGEIKNSMTDSPVTGYDDMAGLYVCLMFMSVLVSSAVLKKSAGV